MTLAQEPLTPDDQACLSQAIQLAIGNAGRENEGGGPFGAIIARRGNMLAAGVNGVTRLCDPTAHAEVMAIREACVKLKAFHLEGYTLYASCEPCPMCLAAALWARVDRIVYASSREDAAAAGFDDEVFYREVAKPPEERDKTCLQGLRDQGRLAFEAWKNNQGRIVY